MADVPRLQFPGAPNILGAIQSGLNIRQSLDARQLAQDKYNRELAQLELANKRIAERDRLAREDIEIDRLEEAIGKEKNPDAIRSMGERHNKLTGLQIDYSRIAEDKQLLTQYQRDLSSFRNLERRLGQNDETVRQVFDAMSVKYEAFPEKIKEIAGVLEPTELETFEKKAKIKREQAVKLAEATATVPTPKIENVEFFNEAGEGRFVDINDASSIQAAEVLGFKPPKKKKEKEKEFKPIFLQGKLTSGQIDTVTIDRNAPDAFEQTKRLLSFGYAPVKDPSDPTAQFGMQEIRTPEEGPPPPVEEEITSQDRALQEGINAGLEEGALEEEILPSGRQIELQSIRTDAIPATETKRERALRLKGVSSLINVKDEARFEKWIKDTNELRKQTGEPPLSKKNVLDRKEFNLLIGK